MPLELDLSIHPVPRPEQRLQEARQEFLVPRLGWHAHVRVSFSVPAPTPAPELADTVLTLRPDGYPFCAQRGRGVGRWGCVGRVAVYRLASSPRCAVRRRAGFLLRTYAAGRKRG